MRIPFNRPFIVGKELYYIAQSVLAGHTAGDGPFTKKCHALLEQRFAARKVLLTHSCTAALEMAALLCEVGPGDEVIVPSFTFVSTANAFYLRGAKPVFVDIRRDTLNMDETQLERAITPRTKAIVPVHYAGVACEMESILATARRHGLLVVEDAAQAVNATYHGRYLGTLGDLGTYSFHETKNYVSGEGGALVVNNPRFVERAEILREKGTDRSKFFRGQVDKYTWVDVGSSYLPSDMIAAFLYAQLEHMDEITARRRAIATRYQEMLAPLAARGLLSLPHTEGTNGSNGHMFYVLLRNEPTRARLIAHLRERDMLAVFHYVPLHLSAVGRGLGYQPGQLPVTEDIAERLLRLPFYYELGEAEQRDVVAAMTEFFGIAD